MNNRKGTKINLYNPKVGRYPVAGYSVSGGYKIGLIAGYHFCLIITLSKVKSKYTERSLVKIFINFKIFKEKFN